MKISPVVIFCYQRFRKTRLLIESLLNNNESKKTILYIFSDGYKNTLDKHNVLRVRKYISTLKGFKKIIIIKRENNLGLSTNIIFGANYIFKIHSSAIFLEDDLVVSKYFLKFMNQALTFYAANKKVWHISGWNYNIPNKKKLSANECDAFLWRVMNCWGWGTWRDRWRFFIKNPKKIIKTWDKKKISRFNLDNHYNFFTQIIRNYENKINTWAVFWYATIFNHKGLCLNPNISLVKNNGLDKFSTHSNFIDTNNLSFKFQKHKNIVLPILLKEDYFMAKSIKQALKKNFFFKLYQRLKNFF